MPETPQVPMCVELILATGSRAGITAPILNGYYMVGRHPDCQIRPKTRSVSRRHCVVFRENASFKVLDLASTSGTKINHQRIEPKEWCELKDGDELSCGKIRFRVSIHEQQPSLTRRAEDAVSASAPVGSAAHPPPQGYGSESSEEDTAGIEMVAGEAWQTFDVANFLGSQDDADREERYERIRQTHASALLEESEFRSDEFDSDSYDSSEVDLDEDARTEIDDSATNTTSCSGKQEQSDRNPRRNSGRRDSENRMAPVPRLPARESLVKRVFSIFSGDTDRLKFVAAIVVTLAILGLVASQVFEFTSGPPVRVIEDLD